MNVGDRFRCWKRAVIKASAALILFAATAMPVTAGSLETLMADLAKVEERQARFVEERQLGILDETLVTEGTLSYRAPDELIRQDLLPEPALYAIEGDKLRIIADDEERLVALDQEPILATMITPFLAIFAGDLEALSSEFEPGYAEKGTSWTVTLKPRSSSPSRHFVDRIEIIGESLEVQRIDVHEQGGDLSSMQLTAFEKR